MFSKKADQSTGAQNSAEHNTNRREVLARAVELGALLPLGALTVKNSFDHRDYATINSNGAERGSGVVSSQGMAISDSFAQLESALTRLRTEYGQAYYHSRVVPYTVSDGKGHTSVRVRTEHYWAEPKGIPDHTTIEKWRDHASEIRSKLQSLSSPELIDSNKLDQLLVDVKHVGSVTQIGGSLVIYGAQIAAVLGYEELIGLRDNKSPNPLVQEAESKEQLRRGFFKVGATLLGLATAAVVTNKINSRLANGTTRMDEAINGAKERSTIANDAAFTGYIGTPPILLIAEIREQSRAILNGMREGISNKGVKAAMDHFILTARQVEESLELTFSDGIWDDLGDACKSAIITEKINQARSSEGGLGNSAVMLEGLSVGAVMTATIIAAEVADAYLVKRE